MKIYLNFMYSAYFLFKSKGYSQPMSYVSILLTFILALISINVVIVLIELFDLPKASFLLIIPLVIYLEKAGEKYFSKKLISAIKSYQHLESKRFRNTMTVIGYYLVALLSVLITVGITKYY